MTRTKQEIHTAIKGAKDIKQVAARIETKNRCEDWMLANQAALGISWAYHTARLTLKADLKIKHATPEEMAALIHEYQGLTMAQVKDRLNAE